MRTKKKRFLGSLLSLALMMGLMPVMSLTALAEDTEDIYYTVSIVNNDTRVWYSPFCELNKEITISSSDLGLRDPGFFCYVKCSGIVSSVSSDGNSERGITFKVNGVGTDGTIEGVYNAYQRGRKDFTFYVECSKNPVSGVSLNNTTAQVTIGDAVELSAIVYPLEASDKTVKWSASGGVTLYSDSNCTSKITTGTAISTRTVYAKGESVGSATVTVTATNGTDETTDDYSASCDVTVNEDNTNINNNNTNNNNSDTNNNNSNSNTNNNNNTNDDSNNNQKSNTERITISTRPAAVKAKVRKKKNVTVSWKKIKKTKKTRALRKKIKSIQVQYADNKSFTNNLHTKKVGKCKTKVTFKLKRKKTYYVRARYVGSDGYSKWSKVKKIRTK